MKVLMLNGSPRVNGNTAAALEEMCSVFAEEGVETELVQVGNQPVRGCNACGRCKVTGKCVFDDVVNALAGKLKEADGFVVASPVYFASANAVTEAGEVLNVDGNANRVAAITFGPASVILVVGSNKIVKDLAAADARVKAVAAPANAKRLSCKTPCAVTGQCENCQSPGRICCTYVLHRYQRVPGRIKVILVGQELGY